MIKATFAIPAAEFNAEWLEKIRPFLLDAETEVIVQVRRKTKRVRKSRLAPVPSLNGSNGYAALSLENDLSAKITEPFVKKYPSQPTPEEGEQVLKRMLDFQASRNTNAHDFLQAQTRQPISEAEWIRRAEALQIEEPIEELLALLTK